MVAIPPLIWNASLVFKKKIISLISYRIQTPIHRDRNSTHKKKTVSEMLSGVNIQNILVIFTVVQTLR